MEKCPNCGKELPHDSHECPECGLTLPQTDYTQISDRTVAGDRPMGSEEAALSIGDCFLKMVDAGGAMPPYHSNWHSARDSGWIARLLAANPSFSADSVRQPRCKSPSSGLISGGPPSVERYCLALSQSISSRRARFAPPSYPS